MIDLMDNAAIRVNHGRSTTGHLSCDVNKRNPGMALYSHAAHRRKVSTQEGRSNVRAVIEGIDGKTMQSLWLRGATAPLTLTQWRAL